MKYEEILRIDGSKFLIEIVENKSKILCIIFSGYDYNQRNPLLYYSKSLFLNKKYDCISFDLEYYRNIFFQKLKENEQLEYYENDCNTILDILLKRIYEHPYEKVLLIGKSLGASIIRRCIRKEEIKEKAVIILLTPGTEWNEAILEYNKTTNPMLVISSLEDKAYTVSNLTELYKKEKLTLYEMKEGNHLLEVENVFTDIKIVSEVMIRINSFIENIN